MALPRAISEKSRANSLQFAALRCHGRIQSSSANTPAYPPDPPLAQQSPEPPDLLPPSPLRAIPDPLLAKQSASPSPSPSSSLLYTLFLASSPLPFSPISL